MIKAILLLLLGTASQGLRPCTKYEACRLTEFSYAAPSTTSTTAPEPEGSGEGSGEEEETIPLVYDENFIAEDAGFPTGGNPISRRDVDLCSCTPGVECPSASEDEENNTSNQTAKLDPILSLTFCDALEKQFKRECRGHRSAVRVFGELGDISAPDPILTVKMSRYTETRVFCHCPEGQRYHKINDIESWSNGLRHAFKYNCQ